MTLDDTVDRLHSILTRITLDHTLGNMLRMKLLENPKVLFCGYKMAHPLEHEFILNGMRFTLFSSDPSNWIIVQTATDTTPLAVLREEIDNLIIEVTGIMRNFQDELTQFTLNWFRNCIAMQYNVLLVLYCIGIELYCILVYWIELYSSVLY